MCIRTRTRTVQTRDAQSSLLAKGAQSSVLCTRANLGNIPPNMNGSAARTWPKAVANDTTSWSLKLYTKLSVLE
jgi:hypothetical protein